MAVAKGPLLRHSDGWRRHVVVLTTVVEGVLQVVHQLQELLLLLAVGCHRDVLWLLHAYACVRTRLETYSQARRGDLLLASKRKIRFNRDYGSVYVAAILHTYSTADKYVLVAVSAYAYNKLINPV